MSPDVTARKLFRLISVAFLALAVALAVLMTGYWNLVLAPRLHAEAGANAKLLAEAQAQVLATTLDRGDGAIEPNAVLAALDHLLLLTDPALDSPFFLGIGLELDYGVVAVAPHSLDIQRGNTRCEECFPVEIALYAPSSNELVGIARFSVSTAFFRQLKADVGNKLVIEALIILLLLVLAWLTILNLVRKLHQQINRNRQAELALLRNERKYDRLVNSLSQYFVYTRDSDGRFTHIGGSIEALLGYRPEELHEGLAPLLTASPSNFTAAQSLQPHAREPGQISFIAELRSRDGTVHQIEFSEVCMQEREGRERGQRLTSEGIARDISEQMQQEAALREAKGQAEAANDAKSQFLANMSHEIRTPMNAIIGLCYLVLKAERDPRQKDYLSRMYASARALLNLINDILDFSKIEAGKLELETIPFELDEVLEKLAQLVQGKAAEKNLELVFAIGHDVPYRLKGDPFRLGQVLLNLVNNAIKFTEQGEILVNIEKRPGRLLELELELQFSVKDSGIGIEPRYQDRLFSAFSQADSSMSRKYGGSGLGLAICKELVQLMRGEIRVESTPGHGSTFTFTARFSPAADGDSARFVMPAELAGLRALVVDDNSHARHVYAEMLRSFAFTVIEASTANQALALLAQPTAEPLRLLLLDAALAPADSLAIARAFKQQTATAAPLVFLMSTQALAAEELSAASLVDGYLLKPFSQSALFDSLINAVGYAPSARTPAPTPSLSLLALPRFHGQRVLLAEDNKTNQLVAQQLLEEAGLIVMLAQHGGEAVEMARRGRYDAVLMDVQMPQLDGLEATRILRGIAEHENLPIIAMTAHAMQGDREKCLAAGMNDYVTKPIDVEQLFATLARWLPSTNATAPVQATESNPWPPRPGLDPAAAHARFLGNRELWYRLLHRFSAQLPDTLHAITQALTRGDRTDAKHRLHQLKGEAGNLAAMELGHCVGELERSLETPGEHHDEISTGRTLYDSAMADLRAAADVLQASVAELVEGVPSAERTVKAAAEAVARTGGTENKQEDITLDALRTQLQALEPLLVSHNLRARTVAKTLLPLLTAPAWQPQAQALEHSLSVLDFNAARVALTQLLAQFDATPATGQASGSAML